MGPEDEEVQVRAAANARQGGQGDGAGEKREELLEMAEAKLSAAAGGRRRGGLNGDAKGEGNVQEAVNAEQGILLQRREAVGEREE